MRGKVISLSMVLSAVMLLVTLPTACSSKEITARPFITASSDTPIPAIIQTNTLEPTSTPLPVKKASPTVNQEYTSSPTLTPSTGPTQESWRATAIAVRETENAFKKQSIDNKKTQVALFPAACDDINFYSSSVSPNGEWFAASCGYKSNQKLIVQNKNGTKWSLDFTDFLNTETSKDIMGALYPKSWSPEGDFLYFVTHLGYDGGGDFCFTRARGEYGLFRLNLRTGTWSTIIPSTDSFSGYEIEFSPTGRYYAITKGGVMIVDIQTGMSTQIETNGVIQAMSWSPDGKHLAYSEASCYEWSILSSSVFIWDTLTKKAQILFNSSEMILTPVIWADNSTLRIIGEEINGFDTFYTIYVYDIDQNDLVFSGTATPHP